MDVFAAMRNMSIFSRLPFVLETEENSFGPAGSLPSTRFQVFVTRSFRPATLSGEDCVMGQNNVYRQALF